MPHERTNRPATTVFYHDDPPCNGRLTDGKLYGDCEECGAHPDMQSKTYRIHCPDCDHVITAFLLDTKKKRPLCTFCNTAFAPL